MIDRPPLPQRKSPRLQGYDYTQSGAYFVTICTHLREYLFGDVVDDVMALSPAGEIAAAELARLPVYRPSVEVDHYVVMPNHVHAIIVIADAPSVGTRLASSADPNPTDQRTTHTLPAAGTGASSLQPPSDVSNMPNERTTHNQSTPHTDTSPQRPPSVGTRLASSAIPNPTDQRTTHTLPAAGTGASSLRSKHVGVKSNSLGAIVGGYKSGVTRRIRELLDDPYLVVWQGRYHEHIIRNEHDLNRIREYVANNPSRWAEDTFYLPAGQNRKR